MKGRCGISHSTPGADGSPRAGARTHASGTVRAPARRGGSPSCLRTRRLFAGSRSSGRMACWPPHLRMAPSCSGARSAGSPCAPRRGCRRPRHASPGLTTTASSQLERRRQWCTSSAAKHESARIPWTVGDLWQALGLTLELAAVTTVILGVVGLPLAHWLNTSRRAVAPVVETLVALPLVLPPTVIGFYLLIAFSPAHPPGSWWVLLTGHSLAFTFSALVIGSVIYSLPFAVQPFQVALRSVPPELLDACAAHGAPPWRVWTRVHLPLASRGIAAGLTLGFAHTLGEFGVVLMLGGAIPGVTKVASIALYDEVQNLDYSKAHAFAALLLIISFALILPTTYLRRRVERR